MTKAPIFQATYSDFKLVRSRKVVQFVFEVPIEGADDACAVLGGMPNPTAEVWCGIARLDMAKVSGASAPCEGEGPGPSTPAVSRPSSPSASGRGHPSKKSWHEMDYAQQAGVLCGDSNFWKFLNAHQAEVISDPSIRVHVGNADEAAEAVRTICGVNSRSEIKNGTTAGGTWRFLVSDYREWSRVPEAAE